MNGPLKYCIQSNISIHQFSEYDQAIKDKVKGFSEFIQLIVTRKYGQSHVRFNRKSAISQFTVVRWPTQPMSGSEAGGDFVLVETTLCIRMWLKFEKE